MEIREVSFRGAALRPSQRPSEWFPQVAVAGRSNVGKSSLLNWLVGRSVARVAKAPGKTRTLNFYLVNGSFYLVDLPGYGYARVAKQLRAEWGSELERYITGEPRLAGVVALIDIRHGPTALDRELQALLDDAAVPRVVVLTKADKVARGQRAGVQIAVQRQLGAAARPIAVSVRTGDGRPELIRSIDGLLTGWRRERLGD